MLELLTGASVLVSTSALRHGEGLFETIRVRSGVPLRLEAHLARLAQGTAFLGMAPPPGAASLLAFLEAHAPCRHLAEGVLRLVAVDGQLHVEVAPWEPDTPARVAVAISLQVRRYSASPLNRFKTLSYLENRLLAREAQARGLFEVLALNEHGRLTDGGRTSLFVAVGGELLTPPVTEGALPGVARGVLLAAGLAREASLEPGLLQAAEAVLLTNALRGAIPVATLDQAPLNPRHPLLLRAAELF